MKNARLHVILFSVLLVLSSSFGGTMAQEDESVNLLIWQAASTVNPYLSGGTKDLMAGSLVVESLARSNPEGIMIPVLAEEIPTVENGGVSEDLTSITWKLKDGIVWSDGTPFTAEDVAFSAAYCMDPATGCSQVPFYADVETVEVVDDLTVTVHFSVPKPFPYGPFVGYQSVIIQKAQFEECIGENAQNCTDQNFYPIGTGPYIVEEFRANDVVTYTANPLYREEGKPYFQRVILKGGGDAESAARAVLETGEADYAWNLQISPDVLSNMEAAGLGTVSVGFATNVERIMINQTNPDPELGEMRAEWVEDGSNKHPFLTDPAVWKAMSMAIDRNLIAEQLYGAGGVATCNVLPGPPMFASTANDDCLVQDIDGAIAMLDEAGIVDTDGDGVREYNGIPLSITYQTSTNAVRQDTQALVKQWWEQIGFEVELRNIDAGVFFGGDPASPDTYGKFYADVEMYTNGSSGVDPEAYMNSWVCAEVSGASNNWLGTNVPRYCNPAYDELAAQMGKTAVLEERAALAIQMNDLLIQEGALIPLVYRGSVSASLNTLAGFEMNAWDSEFWNIADWTRAE